MTAVSATNGATGGPDSRWWHEALRRGDLLLSRCESCGRFRFPPMPACPHCGVAGAGEPSPATGNGSVYSWVVAHMALDPAFAAEVPYAIVAVDLDEGPRVFGRFLGEHESLSADLRVRAVIRTADENPSLCFERRPDGV